MNERTIAAISTPAGVGGIGIVRISGEDAATVADRVFKSVSGKLLKDSAGYTAHYGNVAFEGEVIDDAVALVFVAPKSYTGENVVEISCHGGTAVMRKVLRAVLQNGAVAAEAGEFTKRAYLNGKLDLASAETVINVINANSGRALTQANSARARLYEKIEALRAKLINMAAEIGAVADYPDEEVDGADMQTVEPRIAEISAELQKMLADYDTGCLIRDGIDTAIVGSPNVGKSTLMNLLSGTERSIVTPVAGTTRDIIRETVSIGDITLNICDTAGIRDTDDAVEKIGVDLSKRELAAARLVLAVCDISRPLDSEDREILNLCRSRNAVIIVNKTDLTPAFPIAELEEFALPIVELSAASGEGLEKLKKCIEEITGIVSLSSETAVLQNERQHSCIIKAKECVDSAKGAMLDVQGMLLQDAANCLNEVAGIQLSAEVADEIFKNFCVGK